MTEDIWNMTARQEPGSGSNMHGGAEGDRTLDLRIANATLSQLSYRPMQSGKSMKPDAKESDIVRFGSSINYEHFHIAAISC